MFLGTRTFARDIVNYEPNLAFWGDFLNLLGQDNSENFNFRSVY